MMLCGPAVSAFCLEKYLQLQGTSSVLKLLFTHVAASSSRILTDWKKHPIYQFWFIAALWQSDSKMKLKIDLRDTEGPSMHYLQRAWPFVLSSQQTLSLIVFPRDSPHQPKPLNNIISLGYKDTTLFFTCISQIEPQSRDWLLNGPFALCLG